jgi:hypothetical protein
MRVPRLGRLAIIALALAVHGAARADDSDPPTRVAQLSYVEGAVSLEPAGMQEWTTAERNRPLVAGDRLWTDQESVAELDLGDAVLRLGGMTGFAFLNLDDRFAQIQLSTGICIIRVRDTSGGQSYEIDTPNLAVALRQPGLYRFEVDEPGNTTLIKVSEGQALALGSAESIPIAAPQVMVFSGSATLSYSAASLGPADDLDNWSATRDSLQVDSPSQQYVAEDTPGSEALDDNGRWQSTPDYGYAWTPAVVTAAWAPYRFGHWVWIVPWGWTWVDDAPWGYVTSHYGRWVFFGGSWWWLPGSRALRPVYAPALVAWVHGHGFAPSGASVANVGWLPLGPRETYVPAVPVSDAYLRKVNLASTLGAGNNAPSVRYVNSTATAITQVPQGAFIGAQRVSTHTLPVTAATLTGIAIGASAPPIAPVRQSVLGAGGAGNAHPPPALAYRAVVSRAIPARSPASFETQLAAIQANGGRPLGRADLAQLRPGAPTAAVHALKATAAASGTNPRPFASSPSYAPAVAPLRSDRPAWATQRAAPPPDPSETASPPPLYQSEAPTAAAAASAPAPKPQAAPGARATQPRATASKQADSAHKESHTEPAPRSDRGER